MFLITDDMDEDTTEQQENECLALQSILGEEAFQFELPNGTMQISPNQKLICVVINKNDSVSSKTSCEKYEVEYLPPFTLTFTLPENYPSNECPSFILTCSWLNKNPVGMC